MGRVCEHAAETHTRLRREGSGSAPSVKDCAPKVCPSADPWQLAVQEYIHCLITLLCYSGKQMACMNSRGQNGLLLNRNKQDVMSENKWILTL